MFDVKHELEQRGEDGACVNAPLWGVPFQSTTSRVFDFILAAAKEVEASFHKTLTKKVTCIVDLGRTWLLSVAHCLRRAPCVAGKSPWQRHDGTDS
jgi:hypothetical protein